MRSEISMGAETKIGWADHTFNPWWGCTHVHAGCTNCYAEAMSKRTGRAVWGIKQFPKIEVVA